MAVISLILWEHQARKADQKFPIRLRISHLGKKAYQTLGYVHKRHWNEKQTRVTTHDPYYSSINQTLQKRKSEVEELIAWHEEKELEYTGQQVISVDYESWKKDSGEKVIEVTKPRIDLAQFLTYHHKLINMMRLGGKARMADRYDSQADIFKMYLKSVKFCDDVRMAVMDEEFILEYFAWCKTRRTNLMPTVQRHRRVLLPNKNNTLLLRLAWIGKIINHAHAKGVIGRKPYVTRNITANINREKTVKAKLTKEEIARIEALSLSADKTLEKTRDTWMLQFYLYGTRISDVLNLRNGWVTVKSDWTSATVDFHQMKTDAIFTVIVTNPKALAIIRKYRQDNDPDGFMLPWIKWRHDPLINQDDNLRELEKDIEIRTGHINKRLKDLARMADIEKSISTHVSRHSVAFQARKNKIPLEALQQAFRHSSIGMTAVYMEELAEDEVADAMKSIYE